MVLLFVLVQAPLGWETRVTPLRLAGVPPPATVREFVVPQMVGGGERPPTCVNQALVWALTSVDPLVLLEVALGCELLGTLVEVAIERFPGVQPLVRRQSILRVEGFVTTIFVTIVRSLPGMNPAVYFEAVRGEKGLLASVVVAPVVVLSLVGPHVCPKVRAGGIRPLASVIDTLEPLVASGGSSWGRGCRYECSHIGSTHG